MTFDVSNAIASKTPAQPPNLPPYNFVFLDACHCGDSSQLSYSFGIHGTDRAFLGWPGVVADNQHNVDWATRLFKQLAAGYQLLDAINWASDPINGDGPEWDALGTPVTPTIFGDSLYKLHGIYGKPKSLDWH